MAPYAIRGFVWDQGENGTGIAGADQTTVMPALVQAWRSSWGDLKLPFYYIQKTCYPASLPAVLEKIGFTAQISNLGLKQTLHPPDKAAYAQRVFNQMKDAVYNKQKK